MRRSKRTYPAALMERGVIRGDAANGRRVELRVNAVDEGSRQYTESAGASTGGRYELASSGVEVESSRARPATDISHTIRVRRTEKATQEQAREKTPTSRRATECATGW